MTKRQKSSLKFFTETETNKTLKLKSVENTEKKMKKKNFFQGFMPKKLKNVNKTLKTENFY